MVYQLYIAGEDIEAGDPVVIGGEGKVYRSGLSAPVVSILAGKAVERLREGLRVQVHSDGQVCEDDA